ncbi:MAG: PD-(D/E)XK nuclease-like domain-containing protein [Planctomycetes bacterium]|nr:PD-(D/E)XK nuclease-like domain-containing protein [Planctomycetota bacterium]
MEYHADPANGSTMLETFRESRREYHALYIAKSVKRKPPTEPMILGSLVHLRLLEPERVEEQFATLPPVNSAGDAWNWRTKDHRDERDDWIAKQAPKTVVATDVFLTSEKICSSIVRNWHARRLIEGDGEPEFSIFWTDADTGLECKCRIDWMAAIPLDIKTTCDPSPVNYARQLVNLGYHRKLAHYLDGLAHYVGEPIPMVHLAVGTKEPHLVATYDIDDRDTRGKSLGVRQRRRTLRQLAACYDANDWREPWEKQFTTLRLPGWAFGEDDWRLE